MHSSFFLPLFLSPPLTLAAGLYPKGSPVLNLDPNSYEKLIVKSNYTSIVEFYAPWCGHCKNLQPHYEKAAASLTGIAKVAAINCDDESNKPFCGSMGVQGFPTLKIVKPSKKPGGRGTAEDYQGPRTAKGMSEAVVDKISNHVTRLKDDTLTAWLDKDSTKPKALFFTEKGVVSPLMKAIAIDFLGTINVAQIKSTEKSAVAKFEITSFPTVLLLSGADKEPIKHMGDMKKPSLIDLLSQVATPNPDAVPEKEKPKSKLKPKASAKTEQSKSAAKDEKPGAMPSPKVVSVKLEESSIPIQSSKPSMENGQPLEPAAQLTALDDEDALQKACLHTKSSTCILAFTHASGSGSTEEGSEHSSITSLREIANKHKQRGATMFPFYTVPGTNAAGQNFVKALGASTGTSGAKEVTIFAINAKKGWWSRFGSEAPSRKDIDDWVDSIRLGDVKKEKLPEGLIKEIQDKVTEEQPTMEKQGSKDRTRMREQVMQEADRVLQFSDDSGLSYEFVELDDEAGVGAAKEELHDEL